LKFNKLEKGKIFRNYKELCFELEIETTYNNKLIYNKLAKYCFFYRKGHKIHILDVYENELIKYGSTYGNVYRENIFGVIYKIKNKINKKVYIGQTTRKNGFDSRYGFRGEGIERVYGFYKAQKEYGENYNKHLLSSIEKYGFDAFEVNKIFDIAYSKEELDKKEIYWIKYFKSTDKEYGYNRLIGGEGFTCGKSAYLSKLGKTRKPIICLETNEVFLTVTDASKKSQICDNTIRNVCIGKFKSAYSKEYNKRLTFEYIDLELKTSVPVICITTKETFKNPKEATEYYKVDRSSIVRNCQGKIKSAGKHPSTGQKLIWKFTLDYMIQNNLT
jgi:hypothetical protein